MQSFLAGIHITEVKADEFVTQYANELKNRMWKEAGVTPMLTTYAVSKIAVNVYVMALANKLSTTPEGKKMQLNRFTPGFAKADMHEEATSLLNKVLSDMGVWIALHHQGGRSDKVLV